MNGKGKFKIFLICLLLVLISAPNEKSAFSQTTDFDRIRSLPYVNMSVKTFKNEDNTGGVLINNSPKVYPGLNLYSSGHEDEACLIDMSGNLLHKWSFPRHQKWPDWQASGKVLKKGFRLAHAFANLDLLVIFDYLGLMKLDKNSDEIWSYKERFHHDFWITPENDIYVLNSKIRFIPRLNEKTAIQADEITVLDSSGKFKESYALLEMFEQSPYAFLLPAVNNIKEDQAIDFFHANSIQVFDGRLSALSNRLYQKGNILISSRNLSLVFICDPKRREIVWAWGPTNISYQHKARLLDNGHILIFNNGLEKSSVIEIDPLTRKIIWEHKGTSGSTFFSEAFGSNQRLPNGNTLITVSMDGTAFEVTPEHEVVWKFKNPATESIIIEMYRYQPNYFTGSLKE